MRRVLWIALWALAGGAAAGDEFSGQVRAHREQVQGTAPPSTDTLDAELRGHWKALSGNVVFTQQRLDGGAWHGDATVNELYASGEALGWQWSGGRKIVAWDVGYGFRPNDVVQQEQRRTLLATTPQGRGVLQAEHFDADTAWTLVWVNPRSEAGAGGDEEALAARVYRRVGAADWHGFARVGEHSRGSIGAATSWVATESLELHASARRALQSHITQALAGATWTGESKLSLTAEAWFDGSAARPQPRGNVYLRAAWEHEGWQPVVDLLLVPADRGRIATAALGWQGDRWRFDGGVRWYGGPETAAIAHLPIRRLAFFAATWPF
ncbi:MULTISPECIES: hypothetical protein [unclassified Rhizobacter]|uniref:hypothetical protein n=1 Tax=unclassified Rhizobacter TaxID=2640088 RepID=UPI0006FD4930|nr:MULTISPECIES: hypothetical protein [unclassified Rhizobacter]KQU78494.1 hypothetical protein ASC88_22165 [Rhizobacter sp. Root29]KQW11014.1 hypothetical protein ASC98_03455 [Rhizobacter sp. Root1238]KRB25360.1 hypothetical protein ASE08_04140 [Rhizobacter sp. Root16D2]